MPFAFDIRLPRRCTLCLWAGLPVLLAASLLGAGEAPGSSWTQLAPMPTCRSEIAAATVDGRIYVVGGVSHFGSLRAFESLEIARDRWKRHRPIPTNLNHCGVAAVGPIIFVSGGFEDLIQKRWSDRLFAYDTRTGRWEERSRLPEARVKHFMIERDGWLHLIGGLRQTEIWSYHVATDHWRRDRLPALPERRDHISVLQDEGSLYIIGGRRDSVVVEDCWRYDFDGRGWKTFARLPLPRAGHTAALWNGRIHVVGGEDFEDHRTYARHDIFDLRTGRWQMGPPLPQAKHGMASVVVGGRWFVFGGGRKSRFGTVFSASRHGHVLDLR